MQQIKTNDHIQLHEPVRHITVIIYDQYSLPQIQQLVDQNVLYQDNLLLYRNTKHCNIEIETNQAQNSNSIIIQDLNKLGCYYLIIQVIQENSDKQYQEIQRILGFGDRIIGIGIDRQKQAYIQRQYFQMLSKRKYKNIYQHNQLGYSLHFVNNYYKKSYTRTTDQIYYWKTMKQIDQCLQNKTTVLKRYNSLSNNMQNYANKKRIQQSKNQAQNIEYFTIQSLINIFMSCQFYSKPTFQVKQMLFSYNDLKNLKDRVLYAQGNLYESVFDNSHIRLVQKKLQNHIIPNFRKRKLQWKYKQFRRYKQLLDEQTINKQLIIKYKTSPIYQLSDNIINLQIREFYRSWIRQTLKRLKKSFNLIANRRDIKAIQHFRQISKQIRVKIQNCLQSQNLQKHNKEILQKVSKQIEEFIEYHEAIIQGKSFFGGLEFYRKQLGYYWRNQRRVYQRIGLFSVIIILALLQQNVILGFTIAALGLIFSSVNI